MRKTIVATATTAAALCAASVVLAAPAAAARPVITTFDTAFTTLADDDVAFFVDGYDYPDRSVGAVELFAGSVECFLTEASTLDFDGAGVTGAVMRGSTALTCADRDSGAEAQGIVTVDLSWTASGPAVTSRFVSQMQRCISTRSVAPAIAEGSIQLVAPELGLDVALETDGERPAEVASQQDRCWQPDRS